MTDMNILWTVRYRDQAYEKWGNGEWYVVKSRRNRLFGMSTYRSKIVSPRRVKLLNNLVPAGVEKAYDMLDQIEREIMGEVT